MSVDLRLSEPEWVPSIYFGHRYGQAAAAAAGGRWVTVATTDGSWQVPLIVTELADGHLDAVSPYGYSGIHADPELSPADVDERWNETIAVLRGAGVPAAFLRFGARAGRPHPALSELSRLSLAHVSDTILVATPDPEAVWDQLRGRARTAVRKARSEGYTAAVTFATSSDLAPSEPFRRLYDSTMHRLGAAPGYVFDDQYYTDLLDGLGSNLHLVTVTDPAGDVAATCLVMIDSTTAHYHLSGSDPAHVRSGVNNLLVWSLLEWAAESEIRAVHLGGGTRAGDSLYTFKSAFGGDAVPFFTGRAIVDPDAYDELVTRRAAELGVGADKLVDTGYFPAYRAVIHD